MLKALSRNTLNPPFPAKDAAPIPDPWELPTPATTTEVPETWQLLREDHPLISPAGNPEALSITGKTANPIQVLLQDWLKLKAGQAKKLTVQFREALSLLYWAEIVPEPS